ncbi:MAG TPA: nuclear transport factor 2 family protein [Cytophagales bacterium]|nr:nuclear transport factor 2 family protein [Cytophagales bacterium]
MIKSLKKIFSLLAITLMFSNSGFAQSATEKEVASEVEKLKNLLVNPDKKKLQKISANELSYGHSSGKIESKEQFIESLVSGQSNFVDITLSDQTINVIDNTAVVRHKLFANTNDPGKGPSTVNLSILLVWAKQNGEWKLLARQAVKI